MNAPASRRGLLGFLAGLARAVLICRAIVTRACVVTSSLFSASTLPDNDTVLIQLCREFMRLCDQERPLIVVMRNEDDATADAAYETCLKLWEEQDALLERIIPLAARTDAATTAKAVVAAIAIRHRDYEATGTSPAERSLEARLALSLCRDMGA